MEKEITFQQDVNQFLRKLILILFENDYFGFEENAELYVSKIYDFIENDLSNFPPKKTPEKLVKLGTNYTFYKANENTTWYIFFEKKDNRYLITYITNNHSTEAQYL